MKHQIFFLILSLTFLQCTKDNLGGNKACTSHENLTDMQGRLLFDISYPLNEMAYFNPNNSDEIIYRHDDGITSEFDLVKYNLVSKEKEVIYRGVFTNRPRWGKNDWILLNIQDSLGYNIYKIRDDGSDLTPLTISGNCFNPKWDINSEKFIYQFAFTTPTKSILMNEYGVFLDTFLCGGSVSGSWQHSELIASASFKQLSVYNPNDCEPKYKYETNGVTQSLNGAEWIDEENVFWCHTTGIYRTNIITNETILVRATCNACCYQRPTYAPEINKIIVEKLERIKDSGLSGRTVLSFVMMNPDGTEEELIEIE